MAKHVKVMWSLLKDIIYTSPDSVLSSESELVDGMSFQESHTVTEALVLLQKVIYQNSNLLLDLIVSDEDIKRTVDDIHQLKEYNGITLQSKQRLHAVGCILYLSAKASIQSCNRVFEGFFPRLIHALGISLDNSDAPLSSPCNFGATYLCVELLAGCRALIVGTERNTSTNVLAKEAWCNMLRSYDTSLTKIFGFTLVTGQDGSTQSAYLHYGGTYPCSSDSVSLTEYRCLVLTIVSICMCI